MKRQTQGIHRVSCYPRVALQILQANKHYRFHIVSEQGKLCSRMEWKEGSNELRKKREKR